MGIGGTIPYRPLEERSRLSVLVSSYLAEDVLKHDEIVLEVPRFPSNNIEA